MLALLGLFDSLYLLWAYTSPSHAMVCVGSGCDEVRASAYSHLWGVPLPYYGAAAYGVLVLLMLAETLVPAHLARGIQYTVAGAAAGGFLFSLYLTYLEAFVIHAWCTWCVVSALAITGIFALALLEIARPASPPEPVAQYAPARRQFGVCAVALLVALPAFHFLTKHETTPPPKLVDSSTLREYLVRSDSHLTGDLQAPVTVVEFGDFQCPYCGRAEEAARQIRAKYGSRIRFSFRQYPMLKIHAFAEKAAEASECAADQGKFWQAVDRFYAGQSDLSVGALFRYAADIGLDQNRFRECLASGAEAPRVHRDMEDGAALGVTKTPTFFIDGLKIEGVVEAPLFSRLIDQALARKQSTMAKASEPPPIVSPGHTPKAASPVAKAPTSATVPDSSSATTGLLPSTAGDLFSGFQAPNNACSEEEAAKRQPTLIGTGDVRQLLTSDPKALFVDVRGPQEYARERIPGAINIPVDDMEKEWSKLPKNRTIVLYESGRSPGDVCAASRAAGRVLLGHGLPFELVKVYQEGLSGWEKAGLKIEP